MERREPPRTDEGWYVLHDFRSVDWDAWREAPDRRRERAIEEGIDFLTACERVADAPEGESTTVSILGHEADLLFLHLRPSMADLDVLERRFERTALAEFTERSDSYLSVTEASGYLSPEYFEDDGEVDSGTARYIRTRLEPSVPDAEYVCFYPMDKRRDPEYNWYDLPFDERADHISGHGEIGREYAGRVTQIISGSIGFDDHEWGVTLFADDPTDVKDILYEMRFDPSSSRYAEFGRFRFGRRFAPENLGAYLAGEPVPEGAASAADGAKTGDESGHPHGGASGGDHRGGGEDVRDDLDELGVYAGQPHGEDVHAVVVYSAADPDDLFAEVEGLRSNFDHYDTHVKTAVYEPRDGDGEAAVASVWETERAANTAAGFLAELPDVVRQAGGAPAGADGAPAGADGAPAGADGASTGADGERGDDSWGTMGMFYAVEPASREEFVATFEEVGDRLAGMDGHRKTDLLVNREDECDMFIASRWDSREDAMAFFRSDEFAETVEWGRDVLEERPRHVFLA